MPPLRDTGQSPEAERPEYAGQYRLEGCLGTGGMGVVHLATSASGLRLAVKVIHTEHASDPEFRARFRQEIAAARRVSGAFTASVVDADPTADRPWMATLFIDGPTLSERVKRNPLDQMELRRIGAGLAEALRDIHRAGVVHRDLKPSNVLLAPDGPKVIDFGISRPTDSDLRTETGKLIGTPPFMAPEQFQRPREVGPAADVFAMGSVLVHAATGRGPFDSDSPYIVAYQVVHDEPDLTGVPTDLVPLLRRCLAKDPVERPTPYEVMVALRESTPSSSYDTQAYIPVPRTPDPRESAPVIDFARAVREEETKTRETRKTREEGKKGEEGRKGREKEEGLARKKRRRLWVWGAVGAALVVLVTAGGVALHGAGQPDAPATPAHPARDFRGWSVALHKGGAENKTPGCVAGPKLTALYCAAPGITAARLDPDDGKLLWSLAAKGDAVARSDLGMIPVPAGGLLHVVPVGAGRLDALDPVSGAVRWTADTSSYATVRHVGDTVLLVGDSGRVRALDAATGAKRWERRHGGVGTQWLATPGGTGPALGATPSADGGSTRITAVDPVSGEKLWEKRHKGSLRPVGASGNALYLVTEDKDGFTGAVVRLDLAAEGRTVRTLALGAPVDQAQGTVVGDIVYLSGSGGSVLALDVQRKAELWRLETAVTNLSRPAADTRAVYVTAGDGRLLAIDARRGVLTRQTPPRMDDGRHTYVPSLPAPVAEAGRVYGAAPDGSVFAVNAKAKGRWDG
ncbi:PQQ-binding-like beta-propeller repeat protein [Streptomyces sp. NPDC020965]|uniref:protein kinase domain-containing protein n=1 Tax=Streptomyces sp. NPDC020965 TaxID=3365105 RepID=UPI00378FCBB2